MSQTTVRYTVKEHFHFDPDHPERFDWSMVLNEKERSICQTLAQSIVERRAAWVVAGREGMDPLIPGMQEALRGLASQLVWRVSVERKVHGDPTPAAT